MKNEKRTVIVVHYKYIYCHNSISSSNFFLRRFPRTSIKYLFVTLNWFDLISLSLANLLLNEYKEKENMWYYIHNLKISTSCSTCTIHKINENSHANLKSPFFFYILYLFCNLILFFFSPTFISIYLSSRANFSPLLLFEFWSLLANPLHIY